jgi:uncharacterized protein (TIGR02996 family)
MDDDRGFREAIREHPDDDLHRLAWADWLDESGQIERAEFIRAQLRLASLPEDDPTRDADEDAADDLLAPHEKEWAGRVGGLVLEWQWRRGCIEQVTVWADTLLRHGEELFALAPIREIRLLAEPDDLPRLAGRPFLQHLEVLDVSVEPPPTSAYRGTWFRDGPLMALLGSPHWTRLTSLRARAQGIEAPFLQTLIQTGLLKRLRQLDLRDSRAMSDRAVRALAEVGAPQLEMLDLVGTNMQPGGLRAVLRSDKLPRLHDFDVPMNPTWLQQELSLSPIFSRLTTLTLPINGFGQAELERFLQSLPAGRLRRLNVTGRVRPEQMQMIAGCANLAGLRDLQLRSGQLRDSAACILASSPHFGRLSRLNLGGNQIGGPGIRAVVNSPHLSNLRELELCGNYVGTVGCEILASKLRLIGPVAFACPPSPRRLISLDLADANLDADAARLLGGSSALSRLRILRLIGNRLGDDGVKALASSPHLRRLRELQLDNNGIDSPGAEALLSSSTLERVVRLGLRGARISPHECEQLRERFGQGAEV